MKKVILNRFEHEGRTQLSLNFEFDEETKAHVEQLSGVRWSEKHSSYFVPFSDKTRTEVYRHLRKKNLFVDYRALTRPERSNHHGSVEPYHNSVSISTAADYSAIRPLVPKNAKNTADFFKPLTERASRDVSDYFLRPQTENRGLSANPRNLNTTKVEKKHSASGVEHSVISARNVHSVDRHSNIGEGIHLQNRQPAIRGKEVHLKNGHPKDFERSIPTDHRDFSAHRKEVYLKDSHPGNSSNPSNPSNPNMDIHPCNGHPPIHVKNLHPEDARNTMLSFNILSEDNKKAEHPWKTSSSTSSKSSKKSKKRQLSDNYKQVIRDYVKYLKGLRLSESTVRTYFTFIADFFDFIPEKPLKNIDNTDVRLFTEYIVAEKKYSISSHRQLISAIKHFSDFCEECTIENPQLKRPSKSNYLPTVLSQREVIDLLRVTANLKHRAVLALIYSAGLRIGEAIDLPLAHIDIDRRQIFIKNAKGRKDRFVILAESFLPLFHNYFVTYRPTKYFVEGNRGTKYSANSVRAFLKRSCKKAGIQKKVTPHTLRHSYATHLIENGTGLRHVQELLGHSKPETTMIYTHVAKKDLLKIKSPLDTALMKLSKSDKSSDNMFLSGNFIG